jgi:hypothetical protein
VEVPPAHFCCKEALCELLAHTSVYADSNAIVVPYSKELVSWPRVNQSHDTLLDCLGRADPEWFREWRTQMLRPVAEARALRSDCGLRRPYVEPSLLGRPRTYADFLFRLMDSNMLRWTLAIGRSHSIAPFFVGKKDIEGAVTKTTAYF